ncbi:MAG: LytR/AlgR family response regulator transcription factor [Syntrophothermus sp.]
MYKVILIEDDQFLLENIETILEEEKFNVFTAANGRKGIKLIEEIHPDVIISDIMLPDIEGYEILKHVRQNSEIQNIPFLFLTARTDQKDMRQGMNLGADDYLTKPFNAKELIEALHARLELAKIRMENSSPQPQAREQKNKDILFLQDQKGISNISPKDIVLISAAGEYSEVFTCHLKKHTVKKLLKEWEEILPEDSFIRIHRSTIINIKYILKVEKWFNYSLRIHLDKHPEPVDCSRRYASRIKKLYFV